MGRPHVLGALLAVAWATGVGCGGNHAAAPADAATGGGGASGGAAGGDGSPTGPLAPIVLAVPAELAGMQIVLAGFDAVTAGGRAWISAQTFQHDPETNGPALVYERTGAGGWASAALPATTNAFYPDLCAVTATEAFVVLREGDACAVKATVRIFARDSGDAPAFVEQPAPGSPAGSGLASLRLACFPGGSLVAYGAACLPDGSGQTAPVIFRRTATGEPWVSVPLPAQAGPSYTARVQSALVRADGSGYFVMPNATGTTVIFERLADGSWLESLAVPEASEISVLAGDPSGHAVGPINAVSAGYVDLDQGVWSFVSAPGFRSSRTAALSPDGLVLGGAAGDPDLRMAIGREPAFAPTDLGLTGTVSALAFPTAPAGGSVILIAYGDGNPGDAFEWTP